MEHISDIELIEYVGDRVCIERANEVERHISVCGSCHERWLDMAYAWGALGEWKVDAGSHEVAGRLRSVLSMERGADCLGQTRRHTRKGLWWAVLRLAASIVIGVGIGYFAGKWSISNRPVRPEEAPEYVGALGLEWSTGLVQTALQEDTSEGEQERL
jgi:anti-sigma factor RsiW